MKLPSGLEILEDHEGSGPMAESGHTIVYNVRIFLNRGDEVLLNEIQAERDVPEERIRREGDQIFIDHISTLGKRQVIAGIEKALLGMRAGGFRKIRVGPHLAYGSRGLPGLIPPDAVLNISVWLRDVVAPDNAAGGAR
jgi:FKBP-type peptidyl-prolyl cis-trans isomerase